VVFAALAVFGHPSAARARAAWLAGLSRLDPALAGAAPPGAEVAAAAMPVRPGTPGWQAQVDDALEVLLPLHPLQRRRIVDALGVTALHDGRLSVAESELLRAVCAALDCPLPPLYAQAAAAAVTAPASRSPSP
jgi:hypothetical protein